MGDFVWVLFLILLVWMVTNLDGGGPGRRSRIPTRISG